MAGLDRSGGCDCEVPLLEPRVGGRYRITMRLSDGSVIPVAGVFKTIDVPRTLAFTWGWEGDASRESLVTITLRAKGDKTELTLRQEGLGSVSNRDDHGKGWNGTLNKLVAYLASGKAWMPRDPAAQDEEPSSKPDRLPKPSRVELHKFAEIPASASEVWSLLTDWAGMLRWWLTVGQGGLPGPTLVKCDLVGEHGAVPRTRRMTLDTGAVVEEQIFYQNDEHPARSITA